MLRGLLLTLAILACASSARADTLYLRDGRALSGELTEVTAKAVVFRLATGTKVAYPLGEVTRVDIDFFQNPSPRVKKGDWQKAVAAVQRELNSCRWARQGLFLGGLVFLGSGAWLVEQGQASLGGVISALGLMASALGVIAPTPTCPGPEAKMKVLVRIGLDHDWLP